MAVALFLLAEGMGTMVALMGLVSLHAADSWRIEQVVAVPVAVHVPLGWAGEVVVYPEDGHGGRRYRVSDFADWTKMNKRIDAHVLDAEPGHANTEEQ